MVNSATDTTGAKPNVEVQRSDKGAGRKRARYNSSMIGTGYPGDERTPPFPFDQRQHRQLYRGIRLLADVQLSVRAGQQQKRGLPDWR